MIGSTDDVARYARARGAEVEVHDATLTISAAGGDPFTIARDAVLDADAAFRRLGAKRTTLEDVFMSGGDDRQGDSDG